MIIPKIDPLKKNLEKFRNYFERFFILLFLFLFYLYLLTIFWNLGLRFYIGQAMIPALAILFYYCGVLLEKAKRNWFIGIRTPWTLSSDEVWDKTHQLGGRLFNYHLFLFRVSEGRKI
ncbi:SdpI family protein [bacterium]|nr:SdpI family protein [bacterium]